MGRTALTAPQPQARRLGLCLALALGAHAAVLGWPHASEGGRHGAPSAMEVRMLRVLQAAPVAEPPAPEPVNVAMATTPLADALPPLPQMAATAGDAHEDAQAPQLDSPDAALPGGHGQVRVWLAVEADGHVRDLRVEPEVVPRAFERAIERAFAGSRVPLKQVDRRSGTLCVQVEFKDGEAPSWQAIQPAGACVS